MENEKDIKPPQPTTSDLTSNPPASLSEVVSDGVPHLYGANIAAAPAPESLFDIARGA